MTQLDALAQPPGDGEHLWHLDTLWTFKITSAASGGALSVAEQLLPKDSAPPRHRHTREDEAWCVLDAPATADAFFHATGRPADSPTLPPPAEPDLPGSLAGMEEHGIVLVGPRPGRE